ncbi:MAG: glutamate synthase-related protein [Thermoguttaceae bacterium]|jgi:ferredoxin
MPAKYAIHGAAAPPRFRPIGKLGVVDWREDCSSCHNCVKRGCVYGFYRDEADTLRTEVGYLDYIYQCKGCLSCIQDCTKNILTRVINPEYDRLGDAYFTPDILLSTWFQAETGRIPVSGSGYGGPFSGQGFDSMWTDMSEIVRPTRDGIHGREYISTSVDIGRKLKQLAFQDGRLTVQPPPLLELPLPVIFDSIPRHWQRGVTVPAVVHAASAIGSLAVVESGDGAAELAAEHGHVIPLVADARMGGDAAFLSAPLVMIADGEDILAAQAELKKQNADRIVAIRIVAGPASAARIAALARDGAEVIHLVFDMHGREAAAVRPRHMRDVLREVHRALVADGRRDEITLIASGGVAQAEHLAKAIICGADCVAVDVPLVLALECRLCGECQRGEPCPIGLEQIDAEFAARRIENLIAAWHQQLIEVLGAMGIREVRRLRGETGRAMFFEDLERESFGRIFGRRKEEYFA